MKNKNTIPENAFDVISFILLILFTFCCIYPFYYVIIGSVSSGPTPYFWPKGFNLLTYKSIFTQSDIYSAFFISLSRTVTGTALSVFFTSMLAYLATKREMWLRKVIYRYFLVTMYVSGGFIPWYITMKAYGLKNNFFLYIIPGIIAVFNMILVKTFIESLPPSLEESADLDGAGFLSIFLYIILPLIKPILATITVFTAVFQWNTWIDNYFLVTAKNLQTLQLLLYNYLNQAQELANSMKNGYNTSGGLTVSISAASVQMTMIVISVVPIMLVYPFAQKYFTKGIMLGAVKG